MQFVVHPMKFIIRVAIPSYVGAANPLTIGQGFNPRPKGTGWRPWNTNTIYPIPISFVFCVLCFVFCVLRFAFCVLRFKDAYWHTTNFLTAFPVTVSISTI